LITIELTEKKLIFIHWQELITIDNNNEEIAFSSALFLANIYGAN